MAMNATQQAIWEEIKSAYEAWNKDDNGLMPVKQLHESVNAAPERIGEALAQAATDQLAEVSSIEEEPQFKPLPLYTSR
jgi:hypothetical protein